MIAARYVHVDCPLQLAKMIDLTCVFNEASCRLPWLALKSIHLDAFAEQWDDARVLLEGAPGDAEMAWQLA